MCACVCAVSVCQAGYLMQLYAAVSSMQIYLPTVKLGNVLWPKQRESRPKHECGIAKCLSIELKFFELMQIIYISAILNI